MEKHPQMISYVRNSAKSISIMCRDRFLSARKNGTYFLMPHNKAWEMFMLTPIELQNF